MKTSRDKEDAKVADHMVGLFCLLQHSEEIADDNTLIFAREGEGSLGYSLVAKKNSEKIDGIYHGNMILDETLFFEGFSTPVTIEQWDTLVYMANAILEASDDSLSLPEESGPLNYFLAFNGKQAIVYGGEADARCEVLSNFVIDAIINPVESKRRMPHPKPLIKSH